MYSHKLLRKMMYSVRSSGYCQMKVFSGFDKLTTSINLMKLMLSATSLRKVIYINNVSSSQAVLKAISAFTVEEKAKINVRYTNDFSPEQDNYKDLLDLLKTDIPNRVLVVIEDMDNFEITNNNLVSKIMSTVHLKTNRRLDFFREIKKHRFNSIFIKHAVSHDNMLAVVSMDNTETTALNSHVNVGGVLFTEGDEVKPLREVTPLLMSDGRNALFGLPLSLMNVEKLSKIRVGTLESCDKAIFYQTLLDKGFSVVDENTIRLRLPAMGSEWKKLNEFASERHSATQERLSFTFGDSIKLVVNVYIRSVVTLPNEGEVDFHVEKISFSF